MERGVWKRVAGGVALVVFAVSAFGGSSVEVAGGGVGVPGVGDVGVGVLVGLVVAAVVVTVLSVVVLVRVVVPAVFAGGRVLARGWRRVLPESAWRGVERVGVERVGVERVGVERADVERASDGRSAVRGAPRARPASPLVAGS